MGFANFSSTLTSIGSTAVTTVSSAPSAIHQPTTGCIDAEPNEYAGGIKIFLMSASLICIIISSVVGNGLIFLIAYKKPSLLTIANRYILHLAICQFIMTLMVMPYTLVSVFAQGWIFSCGWCAFTAFFRSMLLSSIVLTLLLISIERYISITAPMRYHRSIIVNYWIVLIVCVWIASTLMAIPPMIGWSNIKYVNPQYTCSATPTEDNGLSYLLFLFLVGFVSPMLIMGFVYLRIFLEARKLISRLHPTGRPEKDEKPPLKVDDAGQSSKDEVRDARKEKWVLDEWRVAKTGIFAISAYAVCWIPFFMAMLFYLSGIERPWWVTMSAWMAMASCSINPYVYVFRSRSMRRQASEILSRMIGRDVFQLESGSVTGQISRREAGKPSSMRGRYAKIPSFKRGSKRGNNKESQNTTSTTVTQTPSSETNEAGMEDNPPASIV